MAGTAVGVAALLSVEVWARSLAAGADARPSAAAGMAGGAVGGAVGGKETLQDEPAAAATNGGSGPVQGAKVPNWKNLMAEIDDI